MQELLFSLRDFLVAGWEVLVTLLQVLAPWTPLAAWVGFWLFAVNWVNLRSMLLKGGWTVLLVIGLMMILVWGVVAPPPDGTHSILGLEVSNFAGKFIYVAALFSIMFLCGSVQLAGCCAGWTPTDEDVVPAEPQAHGH